MKNVSKTPEQQAYRDNLAHELKSLRASGEIGTLLAKNLQRKTAYTTEYIVSKYGYTERGFQELLKQGECYFLSDNREKFSGLDEKKIIDSLIKLNRFGPSEDEIPEFAWKLDREELGKQLMDNGKYLCLAGNIENFPGVDRQELAMKLMDTGKYWDLAVYVYRGKFPGVDCQELAMKLMNAGQYSCVANTLEIFPSVNHQELAMKMIVGELEYDGRGHRGDPVNFFHYIKKFKGLDYDDLVIELLEKGDSYYSSEHWINVLRQKMNQETGRNFDRKVALKFMEKNDLRYVSDNLEKFDGIDEQEIVLLQKYRG